MAAVNTRLQDQAVDHAIDLTRYSNGVVRRMIAVLNNSDAALMAALTVALMQMDRNTFTVERLVDMLVSMRVVETNLKAYEAVFKALGPELRTLGQYEGAHQAAAMRATLPAAVQLQFPVAAVSVEQVYAAALSRPFQGRLLSGWAANLEASRLAMIRSAVRTGFVEGQTTAEIIAKIRGTRALRYADGLLDRSRREVATVVQTALSHTAQTARQEFYDANLDLIKAVKWTSTLDSRTSPMCQIRDGLAYSADGKHTPIGHSVPWLGGPGRLHFNCRSVSTPITKSWRELGIDADDMPGGSRASMDGQVPADTTYGEWLARQSAARQTEVLGATRAAMLRKGTKFDRFFDDKGQFLTLDELERRSGLTPR